MTSSTDDILCWFAQVGNRYAAGYLAPRTCDIQRLKQDAQYGLQLFLFRWAYERTNAPRGFRIGAVKAVADVWPEVANAGQVFQAFYHGKLNQRRNPILDPRLASLNIPHVVALVEQGRLAEAFHDLALTGVGHKIRSFFLRDLICLTNAESQIHGLANYLYCQPIDVWVRETTKGLKLSTDGALQGIPGNNEYHFERTGDRELAASLIAACLSAEVSPLSVNQGMWYFCSNAIADNKRLSDLLRLQDAQILRDELALLNGFLP